MTAQVLFVLCLTSIILTLFFELGWKDGLLLMIACEKGHWKVCKKMTELRADLYLSDEVSATCPDCNSFSCCLIFVLTLFFELGRKDGLDLGC